MDKEVLLAIINGPGSGLTVMVLGAIAAFTIIVCIKLSMRGAYDEGKQAARREGLENLQVTLAKLVHDQAEMRKQLSVHPSPTYPDDSDYRT
jgi:hypothetical protein